MTRPGIYFAMVLLSTCFISSRSQTLAEKIDAIIESRFSENQPGVATIVSQGEEILYRNSMGLANLETGLTIQPDDVFRIGSITKQFTAAAILQLASRQNRLSVISHLF